MQRRDGGWGWEERKEEKQQSGCKNKSIKYIHLKKKELGSCFVSSSKAGAKASSMAGR